VEWRDEWRRGAPPLTVFGFQFSADPGRLMPPEVGR